MPFLEVLTRCYKRPSMLAANISSLNAQTDNDFIQTFLIDDHGMGVAASHVAMADYAPKLVGKYIWILDDDDECVRPSLVDDLKAIAAQHDPDVIMLKMDHGQWGVKPSSSWGNAPILGDIGMSAFVVKRETWRENADAFRPGRYQGDYDFIASIFNGGYTVAWYDVVASRVQRISKGEPEVAA